MDPFMNMTKEEGDQPEIQRLDDLHAVFEDALEGKLVLAPLDLSTPGKKILDSGTADGTWLRGVRKFTPTPHEYYGSDIDGELFPKSDDGIKYFAHSFNQPWPEDRKNFFDLVHIRGSLAGSSPVKPADVTKMLAELVVPGGWVQLQEMNAFSAPANGPAMNDFARMAKETWTGIGVGDFANELKSYLEGAGLKNVQERRVVCNIGKIAKPELFHKSTNGVSSPVKPISSVAKGVKNSFKDGELDALQGRVRKELQEEGGKIEIVIAWGQRA